MDAASVEEIVIRLDSINQLFNAPDADPFSDIEANIIGEAGLEHAIRKLLARRSLRWKKACFVVQLPPDQINGDLQTELNKAVARYCQAKIADNALTIRLTTNRSLIGLAMVTVLALIIIGIGALILNTVLAGANSTVQGLLAAFVGVFIWVILWDPMEALLFHWVSPALENRILNKVMHSEFRVAPMA